MIYVLNRGALWTQFDVVAFIVVIFIIAIYAIWMILDAVNTRVATLELPIPESPASNHQGGVYSARGRVVFETYVGRSSSSPARL
jgi:hypothetical protein